MVFTGIYKNILLPFLRIGKSNYSGSKHMYSLLDWGVLKARCYYFAVSWHSMNTISSLVKYIADPQLHKHLKRQMQTATSGYSLGNYPMIILPQKSSQANILIIFEIVISNVNLSKYWNTDTSIPSYSIFYTLPFLERRWHFCRQKISAYVVEQTWKRLYNTNMQSTHRSDMSGHWRAAF